MITKIRKFGNSHGILLPADLIQMLNLKEGDTIELSQSNQQIELILKKKVEN